MSIGNKKSATLNRSQDNILDFNETQKQNYNQCTASNKNINVKATMAFFSW
jgi:hypothetical protein